MQRGLVLHRSSRVEDLADTLVRALAADPPVDPVLPQEVAVGSRGMERWLRNRIATRSPGQICCNVAFPFPEVALQRRLDALLGPAEAGAWKPDVLAWTVLAELRAHAGDEDFARLEDWLARDLPSGDEPAESVGGRGWTLAREVADLLDRLVRYRPDWLSAEAPPDPMSPWLHALWRRVLARHGPTHHAARLEALAALPLALYPQPVLRIFGVSVLPPTTLRTLELLGRHGRVELYAFVPSEAWWADFRSRPEARRLAAGYRQQGRDDLLAALRDEVAAQHPLLTSLGRLSRDFQAVLEAECGGYHEPEAGVRDTAESPATLLAALQDDLRRAAWAPTSRRPLDPRDRSLQVHACHGAQRQVEVLREALIALFEADPSLRPRDVLVMTPDLVTFAPLVAQVFRQGREAPSEHDPSHHGWGRAGAPRIPVQISDLGVRQLNPVADALMRVLELAEGRLMVSGLADLLALFPVRDRFELQADEVDVVRHWLAVSGARWGLDGGDRARAGLPDDPANTLAFALERLALGAVQADDRPTWSGGVAPVDEVEGSAVDLLGRALHLLRTVGAWCARLRGARTATHWSATLREAVEALTRTGPTTSFLAAQVVQTLVDLERQAAQGGFRGKLRLSAVRRWLDGRFSLGTGGDRPITGAVTLSAMQPMRSVPFRVVVLLGLDDGLFPRSPTAHGFDPMARAPRPGDRDARDEDRHLFLEALLSARDHLLITFTGRSDRTNEALPPAGPVNDLLEVLAAGWGEDAEAVHRQVVVEHPLQPFAVAPFLASAPSPHRPYGVAVRELVATVAGASGEGEDALADEPPLPPPPEPETLSLDALERFLCQPAAGFLRARLGLRLGDWDDVLHDREPVEIDALQRWNLRRDLLRMALERGGEVSGDLLRARLRAEGRLPLGGAGDGVFEEHWSEIHCLLQAAGEDLALATGEASLDLRVGGLRLVGRLGGLGPEGTLVRCVHEPPGEKPRQVIGWWLGVVALAAHRGREVKGVAYGLKGPRGGVKAVRWGIRSPDDPIAVLAELVDVWREGMRRPLRLVEKTSHAFARALGPEGLRGVLAGEAVALDPALVKADSAWAGNWNAPGESTQPGLSTCFGEGAPYLGPDDEAHPEFVELAARLWLPVLQAEEG